MSCMSLSGLSQTRNRNWPHALMPTRRGSSGQQRHSTVSLLLVRTLWRLLDSRKLAASCALSAWRQRFERHRVDGEKCHSLPRLSLACVIVSVQGCRLDSCSKCHGVWLDAGEVLHVRSLFPEDSPIVGAEQDRVAGRKLVKASATTSVVDMVGNLLLLIT